MAVAYKSGMWNSDGQPYFATAKILQTESDLACNWAYFADSYLDMVTLSLEFTASFFSAITEQKVAY